jgi:hypothetical protein
MNPTDGHEESRSAYKSIVLNLQQLIESPLHQLLQQPQLENAIQHLLWVLKNLPQFLPEQPFHQYKGEGTNCGTIYVSTVEPCVTAKQITATAVRTVVAVRAQA